MGQESIFNEILRCRLIAIIRGVESGDIVQTAGALKKGGINCLEVTFDHKGSDGINKTITSLHMLKKAFGDGLLVGAGTVLTAEEVQLASDAGAEYMISPDTNLAVIRRTKELGKLSIPGALSPTEVVSAYNAGADIVKLFPAGFLGTDYFKALRGPLGHIPFCAVGGITEQNAADFIRAGAVCLGIGGNLVSVKEIKNKNFENITAVAKKIVEAVKDT